MKVLIITPIFPPLIGGPATYSFELLERLPPKIAVEVISFGQEPVMNSKVHIVKTQGGAITRQLSLFVSCLRFGFDARIFYLQEPAVVGFVGLIVGKLLSKKIITKYVGDPSWERSRDKLENTLTLDKYLAQREVQKKITYRITKFVLKESDKVIVPSGYLKKIIHHHYQIPKNKLTQIYNSVEPNEQYHRKFDQLITAGRLVTWKNIDLIIMTFAKISSHFPKLKLKILGGGPEERKLRKLAKTLGLTNKVTFTGPLPPSKTLSEIAKSKILILFSDYEGLPHVALEAQSLGTVAVASNISGTDECITSGESGMLVEPKNSDQLTKVVSTLLKNNSLMKKLSLGGQQNIINYFSWQKNLPKLIETFYEVCK